MSYIQLVNSAAEPSTPPAGKTKIFIGPEGPSAKKDDGSVDPFKSVFGTRFVAQKKTADEVNSTTTPVTYDSIDLIGVPQGNYLILVRWVWGYASGANDIRVDWQLDDVNFIEEHRQEPKDGGADQRHHEQAFSVLQLDGSHTIKVDYRSSNGGNQARMYETELVLFRID